MTEQIQTSAYDRLVNHIGALVIESDTEYVHHGYETASAYDRLILTAGTYPFRLTNIDGSPWVPGSKHMGSGLPTSPYYAVADVNAVVVERYYEARLMAETRAQTTLVNETTTHRVQLYAYEVEKRQGKSWGTIGRIEANEDYRADTYPYIERLSLDDYKRVLVAAIAWLAKHEYGDYTAQPAWHTWNQIQTKTLGGIEGFAKAVLENYVRGF